MGSYMGDGLYVLDIHTNILLNNNNMNKRDILLLYAIIMTTMVIYVSAGWFNTWYLNRELNEKLAQKDKTIVTHRGEGKPYAMVTCDLGLAVKAINEGLDPANIVIIPQGTYIVSAEEIYSGKGGKWLWPEN